MGRIVNKTCACGSIFQIDETRIRFGRGKFCSAKCQYKYAKSARGISLRCCVCSTEFKRSPSHIKSKFQFCSNECSYKGRSLGFVQRIVTKPYRSCGKA